MPTVKFTATPTTLIESQGTVITFRFELDEAPPPSGIKLTVKGNVPQSLTELDLFKINATGNSALPEGDFDFSGFDFTINSRVGTVTVPMFDDGAAEGLETVTYTLLAGSGYTVDPTARSVTVNFVDNPSQAPAPSPSPAPIPGSPQPTEAADTLTGTEARDNINGLGGNDRISGLGGNDVLIGGGGKDVLFGGLGNDRLTGGAKRDTFALETGAGTDRILDFKDRQDRLGLAGGITFGQLSFSQRGNNLLIRAGNDSLALLSGVNRNQITQADFTTIG
jgi:hypothetical protein